MIHRRRHVPPTRIYPVDPWRIVEKRYSPKYLDIMESIFATSNGYLGLRGTPDEGEPFHERGAFVNGFHETWPIVYGEQAYGFATTGQTMINVPNAAVIRLFVDDEPLHLPSANLLAFERVLDMRTGLLTRNLTWLTPSGKRVEVRSRRFVSLTQRHAAVAETFVTLDSAAPVALVAEIAPAPVPRASELDQHDPRLAKEFDHRCLEPVVSRAGDTRLMLGLRAPQSGMSLAVGAQYAASLPEGARIETSCASHGGSLTATFTAQPGSGFSLAAIMAYHSSRRADPEELCARADRTLDRCRAQGAEELAQEQSRYMEEFWSDCDMALETHEMGLYTADEAMQAVRFNLFHMLQACARCEGTGVPAKGLTGQAYEGHYFWDMEIYVLPFLIYTMPKLAKNLLLFRFSMLDKARERARLLGHKGATFPWRTINGEEASAYYAAGTAQFHINADIVYALRKYTTATGDRSLLAGKGGEVLVETARFWADLGFYCKRKGGAFCIDAVTGPDEYTTVVDNNLFTNLMARENLRFAAETVRSLEKDDQDAHEGLVAATGLKPHEPDEWEKAADAMFIPYDEEMGIHPQDDGFLEKEPWDFDNVPEDKYPLLLNFHPLTIYRHMVIKQADAILAMYLLSKDFTPEQKLRNFLFYDPLTTGDSSLSVGIQSILAGEVGEERTAKDYMEYAMLMDLGDVAGNSRDGLHIASMGAVWMLLAGGMAGMRDDDGHIRFRPGCAPNIKLFRLPLRVGGAKLTVEMRPEGVFYRLESGDGVEFFHQDERIVLTRDAPETRRGYSD